MAQTKRPWRKLVKKLQRKRRRQKYARARDKKIEEDELEKLKDPAYKQWLEYKEQWAENKRMTDEKANEENEELWLRRELLAQKQFQRDEQKRRAEENIQEELRMQQHKELQEREDLLQRKKDELKKKTEEATKDFEETVQLMQTYLDDDGMRTPAKLQGLIESRPGEKQCEFYGKTHCCRFGLRCHLNHLRPILSRVIVIRNFFQHRLLDLQMHRKYSPEEQIEVSEYDLRGDYEEFCADVWPELEQFGTIVNFRTVRNTLPHSRGTVFVEYTDKRSALKAFINLQNRYYATKRLNVEFSHISHWRTAVCGFSLARKCPKGAYCNYLHIIPNPQKKYNAPLEPLDRSQRNKTNSDRGKVSTSQETPSLSWNNETPHNAARDRSWRWSESPEMELTPKAANTVPQEKIVCESIVLSSSENEREKEKESSNTELKKNLKRKNATTKWSHIPKVPTPPKKPNKKSHNEKAIVLSSSSSDDVEVDGEILRKSKRNTPNHSRREGRRVERRRYKHRHDNSTSSEETYERSPRKRSPSPHRKQHDRHRHSHRSR